MTDNVSIFEDNVTEIVSGAINTGIDGVDDNREGWNKFGAGLVKLIVAEAQRAFVQAAQTARSAQAVPKTKTKTKATTKSRASNGNGKPIYSQWVKGITRVRNGEVAGDDMVNLGNHFGKTKTADKYQRVKDTLDLEGQEMTVKQLIGNLKSCSGLSGEREVTITAIAWGLIPGPRREELALKYAQ